MFRTLGPRGAVGVNAAMTSKSLENLELLVKHSSTEQGPVQLQNRGDGTQWILGCRKMGGRTAANARRRALLQEVPDA